MSSPSACTNYGSAYSRLQGRRRLAKRHQSSPEEFDAGPPLQLAIEGFQPIDLPLHLASAPRRGHRRVDRPHVSTQLPHEGLNEIHATRLSAVQPRCRAAVLRTGVPANAGCAGSNGAIAGIAKAWAVSSLINAGSVPLVRAML